MHYYNFHIRDYKSKTAHLSLVEDAIYRRLIDLYYINEEPLTCDIKRLAKLTLATRHIDSLRDVLEEFFYLDGDVYRHDRIDEDLDKYRLKSEKAKKSAEARWGKKDRPSNPNAMRTHNEGNPNQKPITNNQYIKESENKFSDDDLRMAKYMESKIEFTTNQRPNLNKWADHIRLMRERDGIDYKQIRTVFDWANQDDFWSSNIRSPDKLRKQFEKLSAQMKRPKINGVNQTPEDFNDQVSRLSARLFDDEPNSDTIDGEVIGRE